MPRMRAITTKTVKSGHPATIGFYWCSLCQQKTYVSHHNDRLPPCPRCRSTKFKQLLS